MISILRDASSNRAMLSFWRLHLSASHSHSVPQHISSSPESDTEIAFNPRSRID